MFFNCADQSSAGTGLQREREREREKKDRKRDIAGREIVVRDSEIK